MTIDRPAQASSPSIPDGSLSLALYLAVTAATVVGGAVANATPFILAASMRQTGASEIEASSLLSAELAAFFLAAILASRVRQFSLARVVASACILFAVGNGLSAVARGQDTMLLARLICGLAAGVTFSGSIQITASHHRFNRLFTVAIVGNTFFAALSLFAVGELLQARGASDVYLFYAAVGLLAAPLCLSLRPGNRVEVAGRVRAPAMLAGGLVLVFLLSRLSDAAFWSFSERFGARAGLDTADVGIILGVSICVALGAPLVAILVKHELAAAALFAATLATKSLMPLIVLLLASQTVFVVAQLVSSFCFVLLTQRMLSRLAALDATGRLGTVGGLAGLAGEGIGPVLAGQAYGATGYSGVASLSMLTGLAATALFVGIATGNVAKGRP